MGRAFAAIQPPGHVGMVQRSRSVADVSVVLPFRDAAPWLPQALASLRRQEGVALELIAVDDGSSDGSAACVRQLWQGCPWPLQLIRLEGQGVSAARNHGWRRARAPLVALLDADDLCLSGRLQGQAQLLKQRPELAHCLCGWQLIDAEGRPLHTRRPWLEGAGLEAIAALRHKVVLPSAWMLRRSALEAIGGFDETLSQAEDVDLLLRLALAGQRGAWWREVGCAYRQHPAAASSRCAEQIRSLLWVTARQLGRLPESAASRALRREVTYTTRAWTGWKAWVSDQPERALELWRTALELSPLPAPLTWVHLAENVARSHQRQGLAFNAEALLASPPWRQLEQQWLQARRPRPWVPAPVAMETVAMGQGARDPGHEEPWALAWQALGNGHHRQGLALLQRQLQQELGEQPQRSPWWPQRLLEQLDSGDPLRALRSRVLRWCNRLLALELTAEPPAELVEELVEELAAVLRAWAWLCWPEDPRPSSHHLARSLALRPQRLGLLALARLQQADHPTGAAALRQLARLPGLPEGEGAPPPAGWETPGQPRDRCSGPACPPCQQELLACWRQQELAPGWVRWHPPAQGCTQPDPPFQLHTFAGGQAWIRQPANPWGATHGLGVADGRGQTIPALSRRYPQPWPGCPSPPAAAEPAPTGPRPGQRPLELDGPVLAVAELSAEIYFHWLLEALPRIGLALEGFSPVERHRLRLWHNGGNAAWVQDTLREWLGLEPGQLIDAHQHPWIRAERLLVPDFVGHAGWCSGRAVTWLRAQPGPGKRRSDRRLWLGRGQGWRRPVWGEERLLNQWRQQGLALEAVAMGELRVAQQARLIREAELVVLPHGGAMANLVFAEPGTRVVELCSQRYTPPYLHALSERCQLVLTRCTIESAPPRLYQDLLYESAALEPLRLDDDPATVLQGCVVELF